MKPILSIIFSLLYIGSVGKCTACSCGYQPVVINAEAYIEANDIVAFTLINPRPDIVSNFVIWDIVIDTVYKAKNRVSVGDTVQLMIDAYTSCSINNSFYIGEKYLLYGVIKLKRIHVDLCNRIHPIACQKEQWMHVYMRPHSGKNDTLKYSEYQQYLAQELGFIRTVSKLKLGEMVKMSSFEGVRFIVVKRKRFYTLIQWTNEAVPNYVFLAKVNRNGKRIGKIKAKSIFRG